MKSLKDIGQEKVGVFLSGGLTSTVVAKFLVESNCNIHLFWANVAQKDEPELQETLANFRKRGIPITQVDLREATAEMALKMLPYNAIYEGGYWNSTGALRYVLVKELAPYFIKEQCTFFSHGCVGGGNDQRRFSRYGIQFMPNIKEFTPWDTLELAHKFKSRADMYHFLVDGFSFSDDVSYKINRSTDSCLIGTSYEGSDIESIEEDYTNITSLMSCKPWEASNSFVYVELNFQQGQLKKVNKLSMNPFQRLEECNRIAGNQGVSLKSVFENRITNTKCRGVYESPGMDMVSLAFQSLIQVCFDKNKFRVYSQLAEGLGKAIYRGLFEATETLKQREKIETLTNEINGDVLLKLYKGKSYCIKVVDHNAQKDLIHQKRFANGGLVWHDL